MAVGVPSTHRHMTEPETVHVFRFAVLSDMIQRCPYVPVTALLLHQLKEEMAASWPDTSSSERVGLASGASLHTGPFICFGVSLVLDSFGTPSKALLMHRMDVCMAALNVIRFVLIKDRGQNVTGIWHQDTKERLCSAIINPMRTITKELQSPLGEGPAQMGQQHDSEMHIFMLREVLDRIDELLQEAPSSPPQAQ